MVSPMLKFLLPTLIAFTAVKNAVALIVANAHKAGIKVGICGEAASDPEFVEFLLEAGIDSLSLSSPRTIPIMKRRIRK